jgi:radical SAM superfamily enzyme YgiQ (UPF0313 family)
MSWDAKRHNRELSQGEKGSVSRDPGGRINLCLVYPNTYFLGMSNLGFTSIYSFLNSKRNVCCERAFLPDIPVRQGRSRNVYTVERQRRLPDFHLVGFSLSFENDYFNIIRILRNAGIPPLREERGEEHPPLFCGGFSPTLNPEPLAEIFDFIILGDGEGPLDRILDILHGGFPSKGEFLKSLKSIKGIYLPSLYQPRYDPTGRITGFDGSKDLVSTAVSDINVFPAYTTIFTEKTEFGNMFLIEIARGCVKNCSFCGVSHRPGKFRVLGLDVIRDLVREGLTNRDRVGLVGSAVLDHPDFKEIGRFVLESGGTISPASIRADMVDMDVASILGESALRSAALAPETGSEKMRARIGKAIRDDAFFEAAFLLRNHGVRTLKFYFIAGLPGVSEEEDVEWTLNFVKKLIHHMRVKERATPSLKVVLSFTGFVPKALTPFQFAPFPGTDRLKSTYRELGKQLSRLRLGVKLEHDVPKYTYLQALLSMGDRRISRMLGEMGEEDDPFRWFVTSPVNPEYFVSATKGEDFFFPWDGVFQPYGKERLLKRFTGFEKP